MRGQHGLHRDGFVVVVGNRVHRGDGTTMDDHLRASVAVRLEQHRVHVGVRFEMSGLRLHRLRATNLTAISGHGTVERHVLRLERYDRNALTSCPAAQRRHQCAFAGVGSGALHHQGGHGWSLVKAIKACSRRVSSVASAGRPKRRLLLWVKMRRRMPRRAMNACSVSACSVISHWNSAQPPWGSKP
ncbi:hypothetical protein D3C81_1598540 [compost metagenome]